MAEPIRPLPEEPREVPPIERRPMGVVERELYARAEPIHEVVDLVRWGPIVAGLVTTVATFIVLSVLGAAVGLSAAAPGAAVPSTTPAAIWGALSLLVALFLGGWIASRTTGIVGPITSAVNGAMVWAAFLTLLLILAAVNVAGVLGPGVTDGGLFSRISASITPGFVATTATGLWWSFIALLLGLGAAILGGIVGRHPAPDVEETYRSRYR